mmetsp:Transcript_40756/g.47398  ORF Transcript_40756/g.47398 Transcript_40756/m.47398 type:complete len:157 (-) Transcript_40756:17-487(-)
MHPTPCIELQLACGKLFRLSLNNYRRATTVHFSKHTLVAVPGKLHRVITTDSVVRLKPIHIAALLFAGNQGFHNSRHYHNGGQSAVQHLMDPMFDLEVRGNPECLSVMGDVYRDGFTSCDRWCDAVMSDKPVIFKGAEWSVMRNFLEEALLASFHF